MANNKHHFFNNLPDFEKEAEEEKRLAKMPKAPSFSLEDMEQAREESYKKGHEAGLQQAKDSIEQQTEILVQSLTSRIRDLEQAEKQRHDIAIENAIAIAEKSVKNLLPSLIDSNGHSLIKSALDDFFSENTPASNLTLFVNKDMTAPIGKYVQLISPNLIVKDDNNLSNVQARLEWVDGTYEFKPDVMIERILGILKQYAPHNDEPLDDLAQNTHNNDETDEKQDS